MKKWALLLILSCAALLLSNPVQAETKVPNLRWLSEIESVPIPPAWDGVWSLEDSIYDCDDNFIATESILDTLCGGKDVNSAPPGNPLEFSCTGTATATEIHVTCTGGFVIAGDCQYNVVSQVDGTISGTSYHLQIRSNVTYTGTDPPCGFLQNKCTRTSSYGTRIGPSPSLYCATPVFPSTWGSVKARYR